MYSFEQIQGGCCAIYIYEYYLINYSSLEGITISLSTRFIENWSTGVDCKLVSMVFTCHNGFAFTKAIAMSSLSPLSLLYLSFILWYCFSNYWFFNSINGINWILVYQMDEFDLQDDIFIEPKIIVEIASKHVLVWSLPYTNCATCFTNVWALS